MAIRTAERRRLERSVVKCFWESPYGHVLVSMLGQIGSNACHKPSGILTGSF